MFSQRLLTSKSLKSFGSIFYIVWDLYKLGNVVEKSEILMVKIVLLLSHKFQKLRDIYYYDYKRKDKQRFNLPLLGTSGTNRKVLKSHKTLKCHKVLNISL